MYRETVTEILKRMKDNVKSVNTDEGTLMHDALAATAYELEECKDDLSNFLDRVFIDNAYIEGYDDEVIDRCNELGIYRKTGEKAKDYITIEGAEGTEIEKGTIFQTKAHLQYKTTIDASINNTGHIDIPIISVDVGSKFNVKKNKITEMPVAIVGITKIYNKDDIVNGIDEESMESLYNRYKVKVTTPATSGNRHHYFLWAMEVKGVGHCIVKDLWAGNGTVKLIIMDANKKKPGEELLKNVTEHIEEVRPIGAKITIVGIEEVNINISVDIQKEQDIEMKDIKEKFEEYIAEYLKIIATREKIIRYTKIAACILSIPGVIDYSNLKVNNLQENIKLKEEEIGILGEVELNES